MKSTSITVSLITVYLKYLNSLARTVTCCGLPWRKIIESLLFDVTITVKSEYAALP